MLFPPTRLSPIAISIIIACCPNVATAGFRALEDSSGKAQGASRAGTLEPRYSPIPNVVLSFQARGSRLTGDAQTGLREFVRHGGTHASYVIVVKGDRSMGASLISARVATARQALIDAGVDPSRFTLGVTADYEDDLPAPYIRVFLAPSPALQPTTSTSLESSKTPVESTARSASAGGAASALSSADVQVEIASRIIAISQSGKLEPQTALMLMQNFLGPQGHRNSEANEARPEHAQSSVVGSRPADLAPHWRNADALPSVPPVARPQPQQVQSHSQRSYQTAQPLSGAAALPIVRASGSVPAPYRNSSTETEVEQAQSATASTFRLAQTSQHDVTAVFARAPVPSGASRREKPTAPPARTIALDSASAQSIESVEDFFGIPKAPRRPEGFSTARYVVTGPAFSSPASTEQSSEKALASVPEGIAAAAAVSLPITVASVEIPNIPLATNEQTGPQVSRTTRPSASAEGRAVESMTALTVHPGLRLAGEVALADFPRAAPETLATGVAAQTAPLSRDAPDLDGGHAGVVSDGSSVAAGNVAGTAIQAPPTWHLDSQKTLRDNLEAWANTAGYTLKWNASNYIQVVTPRTYSTEFLNVVKSVGQAVASLVHIEVYPDANPPEIRVSDATQ